MAYRDPSDALCFIFMVLFLQNLLLQSSLAADSALGGMRNDHSSTVKKPVYGSSQRQPPPVNKIGTSHLRRTANIPNAPSHLPMKKPKVNTLKDVSLAEATKYGTLNEFAFFDKVRFNDIKLFDVINI